MTPPERKKPSEQRRKHQVTDGKYPTEYGIRQIRKWRIGTTTDICNKKAVDEFIALIHAMWWAADWGFTKRLWRGKIRLYLSTGGWSGNEEIIGELKRTFFWMFYWVSSRRGGHYVFEIPKLTAEGNPRAGRSARTPGNARA